MDYDTLDAAKRLAGAAASSTERYLEWSGFAGVRASRGQSAYVFARGSTYLASVLECLGTKSVLAREYLDVAGEDRYEDVAYDTVAAVVNDLVSVGALPLVVHAYFAGGGRFPSPRYARLSEGWRQACEDSSACWGGGETPTLAGLVSDQDIDLAGSAVGMVPAGGVPILGQGLRPGHDVVLLASSGIHANGITLAREVASGLTDGLRTVLPDGRELGQALLTRSRIYVGLVSALLHAEAPVSALMHLTGHGLRKVMRPDADVTYRIDKLPPVPAELSFLAAEAGLSAAEAYGTWNMGAGFCVCCPAEATASVLDYATRLGYPAIRAGHVETGPRQVILEPVAVTYDAHTLRLAHEEPPDRSGS